MSSVDEGGAGDGTAQAVTQTDSPLTGATPDESAPVPAPAEPAAGGAIDHGEDAEGAPPTGYDEPPLY